MALQLIRDSLDGLSPAERTHYTKSGDGKFKLELDGEPSGYVKKEKVDEFRTNNETLRRERDELKAKLDGIDQTAVARATELEQQLASERSAHAATQAKVADAEVKANEGRIRSDLTTALGKAGAIPTAIPMALDKLVANFTLEGDTVTAKPNIFSTNRPGEPLTVGEAITLLARDCPFLFHPSSGSGATGSGPRFSGTGSGDSRAVLRNPSATQLGDPETTKAIREGRIRLEYDNQ